MKNKKLTYILLPLVILVWGLVVYRFFFEGRKDSDRIPVLENKKEIKTEKENKEQYILIANYRDPFLDHVPAIIQNDESDEKKAETNTTNLRRQRSNVTSIRWPEISYGGFIKNDKENKYTILVGIKSQNYLVNVGDTIQNIHIKAFYRDSILIVYNNEEKTLKK